MTHTKVNGMASSDFEPPQSVSNPSQATPDNEIDEIRVWLETSFKSFLDTEAGSLTYSTPAMASDYVIKRFLAWHEAALTRNRDIHTLEAVIAIYQRQLL